MIERLPRLPVAGKTSLAWLGQAGFWLETQGARVLIDPYLSDSLARKYRGKKYAHQRMMPLPVSPSNLPPPDLILITHAHTDHMDADTLQPLANRYPDTEFVVPAASEKTARERIGNKSKLHLVNAGEVHYLHGMTLTVFPAAHEALKTDEHGNHHYLGYGLSFDHLKLYHSGDTIPFDDLDSLVGRFQPDIALLPVNGRDSQRLADGIPGNLTLQEAIHLARHASYLIPHHWGMFSFNTLDPSLIDCEARVNPRIMRPEIGESFDLGVP